MIGFWKGSAFPLRIGQQESTLSITKEVGRHSKSSSNESESDEEGFHAAVANPEIDDGAAFLESEEGFHAAVAIPRIDPQSSTDKCPTDGRPLPIRFWDHGR